MWSCTGPGNSLKSLRSIPPRPRVLKTAPQPLANMNIVMSLYHVDGRPQACVKMYADGRKLMTETLSIRIDSEIKKRLGALSKRSKRSKSFHAAEAIAAYVESEERRRGELHAGIAELESGQTVSHEEVSKWLNSWGKPDEENRKRKFFKRLKANLAQDDPHRQDRLINEFRTLILGR